MSYNPGQPFIAPPPPSGLQKKSRRWLWITLILIVLVIIVAVATTFIVTAPSRAVTSVVQQYYNAVEQQDYATAYSYVDQQSFNYLGAQRTLSQTDYTLASKATDLAEGKIQTYTIANITFTSSSSGDLAVATVNITRNTTRVIDVQLTQVNGTWEINKITQV